MHKPADTPPAPDTHDTIPVQDSTPFVKADFSVQAACNASLFYRHFAELV
jgi:hypothetical protein